MAQLDEWLTAPAVPANQELGTGPSAVPGSLSPALAAFVRDVNSLL
jgi:hypothetical protein